MPDEPPNVPEHALAFDACGKDKVTDPGPDQCLPADATAGIRCCGGSGDPISLCPDGAGTLYTLAAATAACAAEGKMLCGKDELPSACTTGCKMDKHAVWTRTECGVSGAEKKIANSTAGDAKL